MIGWWFHGRNLGMASNRIRGEQVMRELRRSGLDVGWFSEDRAERFDTLVIGKRYDAASLALITALKQRGTRIVADLCDNHFCHPPGVPELAAGAERLRQLLRMADHVVSSTPTLSEVIRREVPGVAVTTIGDLEDDLSLIPATAAQKTAGLVRRAGTAAILSGARRGGRQGIVWFGNHGGPFADAGMSGLLRIRGALEELNRERPVFLTVISNSRSKFRELISPWSLPTYYLKWNSASFEMAMRRHAATVIPVERNEFTDCKTDNRVVTALRFGLPVVADIIPSYLPYREVIGVGDWQAGLRRYLNDPALAARHVAEGRQIAARLNDPQKIAAQWIEVLQRP